MFGFGFDSLMVERFRF